MLAMMLKPAGRVIDGTFVGRGQWVNVTTSKTFDGFFVANLHVRGGGKGGGGDADEANYYDLGKAYGEYGANGVIRLSNSRIVADEVSISIGVGGAKGFTDYYLGTGGSVGLDGDVGGPTVITFSGSNVTAAGGSAFGRGAYVENIPTLKKSTWDSTLYVISPANPNGGNYGRGGGRSGGTGTYQDALNGVVQIQLED